jgi:hypothetical protein
VSRTPFTTRWLFAAALCALSGCADTGQDRIEIALELQGTELSAPFDASGGWQVELDSAELAFGPLYLCAGTSAGELCDTARAEYLDSALLDALDPEPLAAATLDGITGSVRSYMYDMGLTSLLTQEEPLSTSGSQELDDHSLRVQGTARNGTTTLPFFAELAIQQESDTERGVPVIRSQARSGFEHTLGEGAERLRVRYDPRSFFVSIDFDAMLAEADCADSAGEVSCEQVQVAEGSQAWRAIRNDVVAGERPSFEWQ